MSDGVAHVVSNNPDFYKIAYRNFLADVVRSADGTPRTNVLLYRTETEQQVVYPLKSGVTGQEGVTK